MQDSRGDSRWGNMTREAMLALDGAVQMKAVMRALMGAQVRPRGRGVLMVSVIPYEGAPRRSVRWDPPSEPEIVGSARLLQRALSSLYATPRIPSVLAADEGTLAMLERGRWLALWNRTAPMDVVAAHNASVAAGLTNSHRFGGLRTTPRPPQERERPHMMRPHYLWKLLALASSPFLETVYLDSDVLVLRPTLVTDLLEHSLLVSDLAMPIDPERPKTATSLSTARKHLAALSKGTAVTDPDMYGRGIPPLCSGLFAYRRTPSVQRLLEAAAARLALFLNPHDFSGEPFQLRQGDQEMLWLQLATAPADPQLRLLPLPEEYACGTFWPLGKSKPVETPYHLWVTGIGLGHRPLWASGGVSGLLGHGRTNRYDCHAIHFHHAHEKLVGARPALDPSSIAAFENFIGRTNHSEAEIARLRRAARPPMTPRTARPPTPAPRPRACRRLERKAGKAVDPRKVQRRGTRLAHPRSGAPTRASSS